MTRLHPLRAFIAILAIALAATVGACLLPENAYQRWQLLDGTIQERCRWIYERVHFDPTPIDVAFIGPSRTTRGVDAPRIEAALAAMGQPAHVVNFSLPEGGRNMNAVIADELLSAKTPRLIVIGVIEKPSRFGHPAFKYIAPERLILNPGYAGNLHYLTDLAYLPFRQLKLFAANVAPGLSGLNKQFDPVYYASEPHIASSFQQDDGALRSAAIPASLAELKRGARRLERGNRPPLLPRRYADVEFGDDRYYVRHMVEAARRKGVKVAFLFLPYYSGPSTIQEERLYQSAGPVWNAGFLAPHPELYFDYAHLTTGGAAIASDWVTLLVAQALAAPAVPQKPRP